MAGGDRQYWTPTGLTPDAKQRLRCRVPFSSAAFDDRDDLGWLSHVDTRGDRRLHVFRDGNMMWATVRDGCVVRVDFVEGRAAVRLWFDVVVKLPDDRAAQILRALRPGRDAGEAMRDAFGPRLQSVTDLAQRAVGEGTEQVYRVSHTAPMRRGVLRLTIDRDGRVTSAELPDGAAAARLLEATRRW